jgi:hypothetical protein
MLHGTPGAQVYALPWQFDVPAQPTTQVPPSQSFEQFARHAATESTPASCGASTPVSCAASTPLSTAASLPESWPASVPPSTAASADESAPESTPASWPTCPASFATSGRASVGDVASCGWPESLVDVAPSFDPESTAPLAAVEPPHPTAHPRPRATPRSCREEFLIMPPRYRRSRAPVETQSPPALRSAPHRLGASSKARALANPWTFSLLRRTIRPRSMRLRPYLATLTLVATALATSLALPALAAPKKPAPAAPKEDPAAIAHKQFLDAIKDGSAKYEAKDRRPPRSSRETRSATTTWAKRSSGTRTSRRPNRPGSTPRRSRTRGRRGSRRRSSSASQTSASARSGGTTRRLRGSSTAS